MIRRRRAPRFNLRETPRRLGTHLAVDRCKVCRADVPHRPRRARPRHRPSRPSGDAEGPLPRRGGRAPTRGRGRNTRPSSAVPPCMRLVSVWRRANPSQSKCQKCGASLSVRCVRPPSEGCVNGQFHVSPCASCDQSRAAKKRRNDRVKTLAPWLRTHTGNLSALHRRFREGMCLEALGFVSEQQVGPYRVDELHPTRKIIVEINGDAVHANPSKYRARDTIVTAKSTYTAREKWEADAKRIAALEALGYWVLVVWQSDGYAKGAAALWEILRAQDG